MKAYATCFSNHTFMTSAHYFCPAVASCSFHRVQIADGLAESYFTLQIVGINNFSTYAVGRILHHVPSVSQKMGATTSRNFVSSRYINVIAWLIYIQMTVSQYQYFSCLEVLHAYKFRITFLRMNSTHRPHRSSKHCSLNLSLSSVSINTGDSRIINYSQCIRLPYWV